MLELLPIILLRGRKFCCDAGATVADLIKITHPDAYVVEMDGFGETELQDPPDSLRGGYTYEARVRRKEVELKPKPSIPPFVSISKGKKKKAGVVVKSCSATCSKVNKKITKRTTSTVSRNGRVKAKAKAKLSTNGSNVNDLCSRLEKCMQEETVEKSSTNGEELCTQMKMMSVREERNPTCELDEIPFMPFKFLE